MRLFHFSDNPNIALFEPRPVRVPVRRQPGFEWLNGPLVWAIEEAHAFLYLFPRECPRIVAWPTAGTQDADIAHWLEGRAGGPTAFIEQSWLAEVQAAVLHQYELPADDFTAIKDVGMQVSHNPVRPLRISTLTDLPRELQQRNVTLRALESLTPLRAIWQSSLHASGIRLRNAQGWISSAAAGATA